MSDLLGLPFVLIFAGIMLVMRIPIGVVLMLAGALGFSLIRGPSITLETIGGRLFSVGSGYELSAIPLFLLMGYVASNGRYERYLYSCTRLARSSKKEVCTGNYSCSRICSLFWFNNFVYSSIWEGCDPGDA